MSGGLRLHVDTASYIEWCVFFLGGYEPEISRLIRHLLASSSCAIDVGANVGIHTIAMAKAAPHGRILACEPNPDLIRRLKSNLELNRASNVDVMEVAVSDTVGESSLHVPLETTNRGQARLSSVSDKEKVVVVPSETVDSLVKRSGAGRIDLIKIDVEGFEAAVLAGAHDTLQRHKPALIFEYRRDNWESCGYQLGDVRAMLGDFGYKTFMQVRPSGLHHVQGQIPTAMNVFASAGARP